MIGVKVEGNWYSRTLSTSGENTQTRGFEFFGGRFNKKDPENSHGVAWGREKSAPFLIAKCIDQGCAHMNDHDLKNERAFEEAEYKNVFSAQAESGEMSAQNNGKEREATVTLGPLKVKIVVAPDTEKPKTNAE